MSEDINRYADSDGVIYVKDGFGTQFCYPRSCWKGNLRLCSNISKIVTIVPISWWENRWTNPDGTMEMDMAFKKCDFDWAQECNAGQPFYTTLAWNSGKPGENPKFDGVFAVSLVKGYGGPMNKINIGRANPGWGIKVKVIKRRVSAVEYVPFAA